MRSAQLDEAAKPLADSDELTPKQKRFIVEYLIDNNATQAAIRAGYSKKSARLIGQQLLAKTSLAQEIARQRIRNLNPSKSIGKTANCDA